MFRPLNEFLSDAVKRTGAARSVTAVTIVEAAGPIIRNVVLSVRPADLEVTSYRAGVLTLAAANPTVAQEVRLHAEPILEVLRDTFPEHPMTRLRFTAMIEGASEF